MIIKTYKVILVIALVLGAVSFIGPILFEPIADPVISIDNINVVFLLPIFFSSFVLGIVFIVGYVGLFLLRKWGYVSYFTAALFSSPILLITPSTVITLISIFLSIVILVLPVSNKTLRERFFGKIKKNN